jgi:hypothetical protein
MDDTWLHRVSGPLKRLLPRSVWRGLRGVATGAFMPFRFAWQSGHFRSSLKGTAVDRFGRPIPWYTYPAVQFLQARDFRGKTVLEFGAGNSTLWWGGTGADVISLEGNPDWYRKLREGLPRNVRLELVSVASRSECEASVRALLTEIGMRFDIVIVDGLYREQMAEIAKDWVQEDGLIIGDDSESYSLFEILEGHGFSRVDFYGQAPGVILPRCTSIWFANGSWLFASQWPIRRIYKA